VVVSQRSLVQFRTRAQVQIRVKALTAASAAYFRYTGRRIAVFGSEVGVRNWQYFSARSVARRQTGLGCPVSAITSDRTWERHVF
jgi:hypothetical protein